GRGGRCCAVPSLGPRRGAHRGRQGVLGWGQGDAVDRREGDYGGAARGETGSLRVGFTASATFNVVVLSAIRTFRRAYLEIYLTLEEANATRLVAGLREGTLDAAFLRPGSPATEELQLRQLSAEPTVVAHPEYYPAAALEEVDLAMLKDHPFLLFPR